MFCLIWQILFILVDSDEPRNRRVLDYFQVLEGHLPCVQILNLTSDVRYKMPSDDITYQNLKKFGRNFLSKNAKVSLFLDEIGSIPESHSFLEFLALVT